MTYNAHRLKDQGRVEATAHVEEPLQNKKQLYIEPSKAPQTIAIRSAHLAGAKKCVDLPDRQEARGGSGGANVAVPRKAAPVAFEFGGNSHGLNTVPATGMEAWALVGGVQALLEGRRTILSRDQNTTRWW